jgi:hypothetical protein
VARNHSHQKEGILMKFQGNIFLVGLILVIVFFLFSCAPSQTSYHQPVVQAPKSQIDPQNISTQIRQERDSYSKEYLLEAIDVIGKCEKFSNTTKYQMYSVGTEAKTAFKKFKINYPQYSNSNLNKYLTEVITKISTVCNNAKYVDSQDLKPRAQKDYDGMSLKLKEINRLLPDIELLISGINNGL